LSAWEGGNAAINSLHLALHVHLDEADRDKATIAFSTALKTDDRAQSVRQAAAAFLDADFGENRVEAAKLKKQLKSALARYVGWVARRNELAHGYVTEAQCPDYSLDEQPIVTVYALLPSHARSDRWYNAEPEWNYLASEVDEYAQQFSYLDDTLEQLAAKTAELSASRSRE
jgi:hypothetical protein